jgi:molecular chaperone Hsp33
MSDPQPAETLAKGVEIRTYFVRERNALVARADFGPLYVDYYLHLMEQGIRHGQQCDTLLKDALAVIALHAAARPMNENWAWTINLQQPLANLFVVADSTRGTVAGNLFTDGVKEAPHNLFCSQMFNDRGLHRKSAVEFNGTDLLRAAEQYYAQSEQRPARWFRLDEEDIVMVAAQPGCDLAWFEALDLEAMRTLDRHEVLSLLEQRFYRFECGCNQERILALVAPMAKIDADDLFGGAETISVTCPRCGARHHVTREAVEAFLAGHTGA